MESDEPVRQRRRVLHAAGLAAALGLISASLQACKLAATAGPVDGSGKAALPAPGRLYIVLDPGHTPTQGGATSIRGIPEVRYNDHFVQLLAQALEARGHRVSLTRRPDQEISLDQRAEFANRSGADLFLSIHHDSAQPQFLEPVHPGGVPGWRSKIPIAGYSVFVSELNPQFVASLAYADAIASELLGLGRKPSLHHAEKIAGENRQLFDAQLGVYRFDDLLVLRKTQIPAVLLEVGVIVDAGDEAYVTDASHQRAMAAAISDALSKSNDGN